MIKVGWSPDQVPLDLNPLVQKNVRLQGSFSHNYPIWERVIHLLDAGPDEGRPHRRAEDGSRRAGTTPSTRCTPGASSSRSVLTVPRRCTAARDRWMLDRESSASSPAPPPASAAASRVRLASLGARVVVHGRDEAGARQTLDGDRRGGRGRRLASRRPGRCRGVRRPGRVCGRAVRRARHARQQRRADDARRHRARAARRHRQHSRGQPARAAAADPGGDPAHARPRRRRRSSTSARSTPTSASPSCAPTRCPRAG